VDVAKVLQSPMKKIKILPHEVICPEGLTIEAQDGETVLDACLRNGIKIEHACEKSCACTTCHVVVREGLAHWILQAIQRKIYWIKHGDLKQHQG